MTHDYKRNGTTDLFAVLNIGTGEVLRSWRKQHTSADVLAFFKTDRASTMERYRPPVTLERFGYPVGECIR